MDAQHTAKQMIDQLSEKFNPENDSYFTGTDYCLLEIIKQQQNQIEELAARIFMLENKKTDVLTELIKAGWTMWNGDKKCPVDLFCKVNVRLRDGVYNNDVAGHFRWSWKSPISVDVIIAYKVME